MSTRGGLWCAALVALAGCVVNQANVGYTCTDPDRDYVDADGQPDPCHLREPADAGTDAECPGGEYVHLPFFWDGPTLLWFGKEEQAPECPYGPMTTDYEGHTDLVAPNECEACTCEPPTGSCALPSSLTASTATCDNFNNGMPADYDAPMPWDGQCDDTHETPPGAAHSLKIGALAMTENGCVPGPPVAAKIVSSHWDTYARACAGKWEAGPTSQSICTSNDAPTPADFRLCVIHEGDTTCPKDRGNMFTERHVFYGDVNDDRQCSACSCGPPAGSICTATISIYKSGNSTCKNPASAQIPITSETTICVDIAPVGQALGSKSAGPTSYLPGTCAPIGGDASGSATKTDATTFCCRP